MEKHEEKFCPKCNTSFICKVGDIANCQCNTVRLTEETVNFLYNTSYDCLCRECLEKINDLLKVSKSYHFPTEKKMFIEGLHYYKEGNNWIFTELYHTLRGRCCQSDCRHCVYGFTT